MSKRLYRSRKNRMVSGVAGGLAEYFDIDPVIIRAIFVITTIGWFTGLLAYIVLWIIVPEKKLGENTNNINEDKKKEDETVPLDDTDNTINYEDYSKPVNEESRSNGSLVFGLILIIIGMLFLLDNILPGLSYKHIWPIALILFGAYILFKTIVNKDKGDDNESF